MLDGIIQLYTQGALGAEVHPQVPRPHYLQGVCMTDTQIAPRHKMKLLEGDLFCVGAVLCD